MDITNLINSPPFNGRVKQAPNGCLIFTGPLHRKGYGMTSLGVAHRVAYERLVGPIPAGKQLDHICHNEAAKLGLCAGGNTCQHRACINPLHVQPATSRENTANGLNHVAHLMRASHCIRGHAFDGYRIRDGRRRRTCSECHNYRNRGYRRTARELLTKQK